VAPRAVKWLLVAGFGARAIKIRWLATNDQRPTQRHFLVVCVNIQTHLTLPNHLL
jgi:hypothetical protein